MGKLRSLGKTTPNRLSNVVFMVQIGSIAGVRDAAHPCHPERSEGSLGDVSLRST